MSCKKCIREIKINLQLTRFLLQNPIEHINAPEDAMKINLVPGITAIRWL